MNNEVFSSNRAKLLQNIVIDDKNFGIEVNSLFSLFTQTEHNITLGNISQTFHKLVKVPFEQINLYYKYGKVFVKFDDVVKLISYVMGGRNLSKSQILTFWQDITYLEQIMKTTYLEALKAFDPESLKDVSMEATNIIEEIISFVNIDLGTISCFMEEDNSVWFIGSEIAKVLGYKNPSEAIRDNVRDKYTKKKLLELSSEKPKARHTQEVLCINEPGLYQLINKSNKPQAIQFQDWLYEQILPSLRRYGYAIDKRDFKTSILLMQLLNNLVVHVDNLDEQNKSLLKEIQK